MSKFYDLLNTIISKINAIPAWAKESTKPTYTAREVGADAQGTASNLISLHNLEEQAHNDIRLLIEGLTSRLNALANSDDTTLDQMSEIVAYIKNNKGLIDSITTSKVSVADIVDNLTTNVSNKPLSAAAGAALKALIDAIIVPTMLSQLSEDSTHKTVTDAEKAIWNGKAEARHSHAANEVSGLSNVATSGNYNDLSNKPTSLPASGGNADTVDNYHIRTATEGDTGLAGYITFII